MVYKSKLRPKKEGEMGMKEWGIVLFISIMILPMHIFAETRGDMQEIRERLIRIEERMVKKDELKAEISAVRSELKAEINAVRGELEAEISAVRSELKGFMLWGFGIVFAGIFALIGFVLWDRRSALAPAIRKAKELEDREERLERAIKEFALKEPRLAEVLKRTGLM